MMQERIAEVRRLYRNRFGDDSGARNELWKVLCTHFLQKHIPGESSVLDVGCGFCEFINNVVCKEKYATDFTAVSEEYAHEDVAFCVSTSANVPLARGTVDIVFMSNLLEHMRTKDEAVQSLREAHRILRPGGRLLILQPNIRFAYAEYWDFWDHHIAISDRSMEEALQLVGFRLELMIPRFLPFTTKSRLPKAPALVKAYLKAPFMWKLLGKQMFCLAVKPIGHGDFATPSNAKSPPPGQF